MIIFWGRCTVFMNKPAENQFLGAVTVFQEKRLPVTAIPAGYAALIDAYGLAVPLPRHLSATGERHKLFREDGWDIYGPSYAPAATLEGHLTFALRYEGLELGVLKRLFMAVGPGPVEEMVQASPTGGYARRIWFLYEWLLGEKLDLPDAKRGRYVDVVHEAMQYAVKGQVSSRHRVKNNLPGTPAFCPMVYQSEDLKKFIEMDLGTLAQEVVADVPKDVLMRAAAFLLLKDSKSSYAIEGESPPHDRLQRWGRAIGEAGRRPLDVAKLLRLQQIVIGDARFIKMGLRNEGGFVGDHDRDTRMPLPEHISARHEDVGSLIDGLLAFDEGAAMQLDPVMAATILAFGFVYIHPFADGNGRIHRYLVHHVLAQRGFNPPGVVFPVSAAIHEWMDEYGRVLEDYSKRLLPLIDWEPTKKFNVHVLNDTGDFYRFFDATPHVEFLYRCVRKTIEEDLPHETDFLQRYDRFKAGVEMTVDMPDSLIDLLFRFLKQNEGRLSKRAREGEFKDLTAEEAARFENLFEETFGDSVT